MKKTRTEKKNYNKTWGPYKSALVAAPAATAARRVNWKIGKIYYMNLLRLFYFSIAAAAIEKGRSRRGFLLRPFFYCGGRRRPHLSPQQSFCAAIEAVLYDP